MHLSTSSRRLALALLGLLLAVTFSVTALLLFLGSNGATKATTAGHGSPSPPLIATSTGLLSTGNSWVPATFPHANAIAFVPGNSTSAYACGTSKPTSAGPSAITLGLSLDSGRTWQTTVTPYTDSFCTIHISATNPQNVALTTTNCATTCSASATVHLAISVDAGKDWKTLRFPAIPGGKAPGSSSTVVWAGTTLFAEPAADALRAGYTLAASVNGADLAWVNQRGLYTGFSPNSAGPIYTADSTLFVSIARLPADCPSSQPLCRVVAKTVDGGATWSHLTLQGGNKILDLLAVAPHGAVMLAIEHSATGAKQLYQSLDGGLSWTSLPIFPAGDVMSGESADAFVCPDGAIYAAPSALDQAGAVQSSEVVKLLPKGSTWTTVAQLPESSPLIAVSCDINGHPTALWSLHTGAEMTFHAP